MELDTHIDRARASRDRGVAWLLDHIASDGEPVGARQRNGWARVPWALAVSGESEAGAAIVSWAERGQIAVDGGFAPGSASDTNHFPAYRVAHFAIGCWLLERFSTSLAAMDALRAMQDPQSGGMPIAAPGEPSNGIADLLSTAQAGLAAIITGQDDIADLVYRWVADLHRSHQQPIRQCLYSFRQESALMTDPPAALKWSAITRFDQPRQSYYSPGMAAVFLAAYAERRRIREPIVIARELLQLNIDGSEHQFSDLESSQACKFGWGAAAMLVADPDGDWLRHAARMVDWFVERQAADGSWIPSTFLFAEIDDIHRLIKTSEHVMQVNAILAALGTARGRKRP